RPDCLDGGHNHGPDQHHGHGAGLGIEQADDPLVAGEQLGHILGGGLVDREQSARHMDHFPQGAAQGHVHPVVVARRQVYGGELAAWNSAACSGLPPSSSSTLKLWPLAWKMRPCSMRPSWLMAPSAGQRMLSAP